MSRNPSTVTATEAMKYSGLSFRTLVRYYEQGRLPGVHFDTRYHEWVFPVEIIPKLKAMRWKRRNTRKKG